MGFNVVGYGCTTCIELGPLDQNIQDAIVEGDLIVSSVLSGNRNLKVVFPLHQGKLPGFPPLVVAYAIAGLTRIDLANDVLATDKDGTMCTCVTSATNEEVQQVIQESINPEINRSKCRCCQRTTLERY